MTAAAQQFSLLMLSIQSQGMALSQWVDAQSEPWAAILRGLPISVAFLLGLLLVLLWKKNKNNQPVVNSKTSSAAQAVPAPSEAEEKLPLLQNELKATLQKNQLQKEHIESAKRALEVKDQQLGELKKQLSAAETHAAKAVDEKTPVLHNEEISQGAADLEPPPSPLAQAEVDFHHSSQNDVAESSSPQDQDQEKMMTVIPQGVDTRLPLIWDEVLVFRSHDASIWDQSVNESENHRAVLLKELPRDVAFLRLRRLDSGEGIVIPIQFNEVSEDGDERAVGFNGSNEEFYGARHLGIYSESLPQEVEVRFAFGGWGFGHGTRIEEKADSDPLNNQTTQACAWAGKKIASDTVMEITVFPRLPDLANSDQLI